MPDYTPPSADWLRDAVAAVLSDFPEGGSVQLSVTCSQDVDARWWWRAEERHSSHGLQLPEAPSEKEIVVEIARHLQDQVFDTEPWGEPRPVCPGHPHPPDPKVIDGAAVWVCPRDGRVLAAIGSLA
jgi:hypothetical protein